MGFSKNFIWAASSASFQIEGAAYEDGKGLSNWDVFCKIPGRIANGHNGDIACDHYHRYEEDVELLSNLGVKAYRFSVSWPRIIPNGVGDVNQKGIDFYNRLIDKLIEKGIIPIMTLFHWDYPYELEKKGAWLNPDSPKWFEYYTDIVTKAFGDRVKYYITLNEPQCFMGAYNGNAHAPSKKYAHSELVPMVHNVLLSHGLAVKRIRENVKDSVVGYAPTGTVAIPNTNSDADIEAARSRYFSVEEGFLSSVAWWSDPVVLGRYPADSAMFAKLEKYLPSSYKEDLDTICQPLDFYGQNIYTGVYYKAGMSGKYEKASYPINTQYSVMNWAVTPDALYWGPKFLYERYKLPIFITENGTADSDTVFPDGKVHDIHRVDFLRRYLSQYKRAADDGVPLVGYGIWSIIDNFEWSEGYTKRFGLVYIDYETQERIPKDSYYWYKNIISENGKGL